MAVSEFLEVSDIAPDIPMSTSKRRRKRAWEPPPVALPAISQETRGRLYAEAIAHTNFESMTLSEIRTHIDDWLTNFLADKPYWYGHTGGLGGADASHHNSQRKQQARREKEQQEREMARAKPPVLAIAASGEEEEKGEAEKGGEHIDETTDERPEGEMEIITQA